MDDEVDDMNRIIQKEAGRRDDAASCRSPSSRLTPSSSAAISSAPPITLPTSPRMSSSGCAATTFAISSTPSNRMMNGICRTSADAWNLDARNRAHLPLKDMAVTAIRRACTLRTCCCARCSASRALPLC